MDFIIITNISSLKQTRYLTFVFFRADIFVFLLSTRAGGLGINLTAADTVRDYQLKNIFSHVF